MSIVAQSCIGKDIYLTSLTESQDASFIATGGSDAAITVSDAQTLSKLKSFQSGLSKLTDLMFFTNETNILYGCGGISQGMARLWDLRNDDPVVLTLTDTSDKHTFTCAAASPNGYTVAVGTEKIKESTKIKLFDLRNPTLPSNIIEESLGDDVTQLLFHPFCPDMLCSGSTDGLACIFDVSKLPSEEDALLYVMNSESSISRIGFFGPSLEYLYMLTHVETLSLWDMETGQKMIDYGDVRQFWPEGQLSYMIDCAYAPSTEKLLLFAGSADDVVHYIDVGLEGLKIMHSLGGAHSATVRRTSWNDSLRRLVTAGEDGMIIQSLWSQ